MSKRPPQAEPKKGDSEIRPLLFQQTAAAAMAELEREAVERYAYQVVLKLSLVHLPAGCKCRCCRTMSRGAEGDLLQTQKPMTISVDWLWQLVLSKEISIFAGGVELGFVVHPANTCQH